MEQNSIKSLGVLYSRYCPAKCQHCGSDAGPHRKGKLESKIIEKILTNLKKYNIDNLSISGGEPLAFYNDILNIAKIAKKNGITLTMFSNAFWAKDNEITKSYLLPLKEYGLTSLMLSTDQFHQKFIDLENIVTASNIAEELDIGVHIMIPSTLSDWSAFRTLTYLQSNTNATMLTHPIHPIGRAVLLDDSYFQWKELKIEGCDLVGRIEIDYTALVAQCPPASDFSESNPLVLGNLNELSLDTLLYKYKNGLLYWVLGKFGPLGLYYLFANVGIEMDISISDKMSNCQLCYQLTKNEIYFNSFLDLTGIDLKNSLEFTLLEQQRCEEIINQKI